MVQANYTIEARHQMEQVLDLTDNWARVMVLTRMSALALRRGKVHVWISDFGGVAFQKTQ